MAVEGSVPQMGQVVPHLIVRDTQAAFAFYERAFGAELLYRSASPSGIGEHLHLKIWGSLIQVSTEEPEQREQRHRVRDRWVARRTAVMNQIRGFLLDRGIAIRKGPSYLTAQLQVIFADGDSSFSGRLLHLMAELKHEWDELERKIEEASAELARVAKEDDVCHRLIEVPGFGPIVSTALVAAIGNGISFRSLLK